MGTKPRKGSLTDLDRISELPNELKERVLVRLPIKEAVKTSCLSSKWRYAWTYIPDLVFNDDAVTSAEASKLVKLVDVILLLHQGPIQKFKLIYGSHPLNDAVHHWMLILSRNGIRELDLYLNFKWEMPSRFFSTSSLTDVELVSCVLKLPRSFNGLKLLKSLRLVECSIGDKDLENLLSSCLHLESLTLFGMYDHFFLRIRAPNLKHIRLWIHGLKNIDLITPMLVDATLHLIFDIEQNSCKPILNDAFGSLCNIERLEIGSQFMEFFANSSYIELPVKFTYLKKLVLYMDPSSQKENGFAVCMLQNAPGLETLKIFPQSSELSIGTFCESTMPTTLFANLKIVEVKYVREDMADSVLPLVKLLLASSPVLVILRLAGPAADENVVYLKKLLSLKRASKDAQIFVD